MKASTDKPYSWKKELGICLLIWPLLPIILHACSAACTYLLAFSFHDNFSEFFMALHLFLGALGFLLFVFGWIAALIVYRVRRKAYFKTHEKVKRDFGWIAPLVVVLLVLLVLVGLPMAVSVSFINAKEQYEYDSTHTSSGELIRLPVTKEECKQYPNRYWFRNLCIICPDGQPLVDGHCQRCPEGQFVLSIGCKSCNDRESYYTPKAECDACPNRVHRHDLDDLCFLLYHRTIGCDSLEDWDDVLAEDCMACPNRVFIPYDEGGERGSCERIRTVGTPLRQ